MTISGKGALLGATVRSGKRRRGIKAQAWLLAGASVLALAMAAPAAAQTANTYAINVQGVYDGQTVFNQTYTYNVAEVQAAAAPFAPFEQSYYDTFHPYTPYFVSAEHVLRPGAVNAIITASNVRPGLFMGGLQYTGVSETTLLDAGTQSYLHTDYDALTAVVVPAGGNFTGTVGNTATTSSSASLVFNTPTGATTRIDTYATHIQGIFQGQVVFDQTASSDVDHFRILDVGTAGNFGPPAAAIAAASGFAPGLYIASGRFNGADTTLQSSTVSSSYSIGSTDVSIAAEVLQGPTTTQIGVRSACNVSASPSTTRPTCDAGNPTTLTVLGNEINTNFNTDTVYHIAETRSGTETYVNTGNYSVTGTIIAPGATVTGASGSSETISTTASLVFNAPTNTSTRVDTYSTELVGALAGTQVFDQTYNAAFSDASVQQGLNDARAAIQAAGHGRAILIAEPVRTASATTLVSSTTATTYSLASETQTASAGVTVGPGTVQFGALSSCAVSSAPTSTRPTCANGAPSTLNVVGGQFNTNLNIDTVSVINTTTTGTDTYLTAERYLIEAVFAAYGRVHPAAQIMALEQSASFLSAIADGDASRDLRALNERGRRWQVFLTGVGQRQDFDRSGEIAASDGSFAGLRAGAAFAASPEWTLGLVGEDGRWHWDGHDAALPEHLRDADSWRLGGFAAWRAAQWQLMLAGFAGRQNVKSATDSGAGSAAARYRGDVYGAGARLGRAFAFSGFVLTPSVGVDWLGWNAGGFREQGGLAPLNIRGATRNQTRLHGGLALDRQSGPWDMGAYVRGVYVAGDRRGRVVANDGVSASGDFNIDGPTSDQSQGELGGHVDFAPRPGLILGLSAAARAGAQSQSYGVQFGLRMAL